MNFGYFLNTCSLLRNDTENISLDVHWIGVLKFEEFQKIKISSSISNVYKIINNNKPTQNVNPTRERLKCSRFCFLIRVFYFFSQGHHSPLFFYFPLKQRGPHVPWVIIFPPKFLSKWRKWNWYEAVLVQLFFFSSSFHLSQSLLSLAVPLQILSISTTELYQWSQDPSTWERSALKGMVWHVRSNFSVIRNLLVSLLV